MSSPAVTFFDPQGKLRDVPSANASKALASGGERAILFKAPDGKQRWVRESQKDAALKSGGTLVTGAPDFTANSKGEGLYRMLPASNQGFARTEDEVRVPFSRVKEAQNAGYHLHADEAPRYQKDFTHQGEGPTLWERANRGIQQALQPVPGEKPGSSPLTNVDRAAGRVLYGVPGYLGDVLAAARTSLQTGNTNELLDLIDPGQMPANLIKQFQQDWAQDHRLAVQNLEGTLVGMGIVAAATHGAGKAGEKVAHPVKTIGELRRAATENLRGPAQRLAGVGPRPVADVVTKEIQAAGEQRLKTAEASREAAEKHAQEVGEAKAETKKTVEAHRDRARVETEIEDTSKQLAERHEKAKAKAEDEDKKAWDAVREKTGEAETEIGPLKQVVQVARAQADPTGSPLFRSILNEGGAGFDEQGRPIVDGQPRIVIVNGKEVPFSDRNYAQYYQLQFGEPPPLEGAGGMTNFSRLQRWYSYINDRMYSGGRLEAGTYNALRMTRQAIDEAMGKIAEEAGATKDLTKARKLHTTRMEAFYDSPNVPTTTAGKSLQETAPEFQKEQGIKARRAKLASYDPQIQTLSQKLDGLREAQRKLPEPVPLRKQITPLPERPAGQPLPLPGAEPQPLPKIPVDVQQIARDLVAQRARKWGLTGYDAAIIGSGFIGDAIAALSQHGGETFRGAAFSYVGTKVAIQSLLHNPDFVEWVSRPSAGTIKALNKIPHADRVKLINVMAEAIKEKQAEGTPVKIAPAVAAFLAGSAAARQPQKSLKELREEAARRKPAPQ
jgi:hypothetical protein